MDCRDVRDIADSFLADELQTETNHEIVRHLEGCPACRHEIDVRRVLRERLRAAVQNRRELAPTDEYLAALRTTLAQTADRLGARRSAWSGWLAIAAAVLVVVALGAAYRNREWQAAIDVLAHSAVGDHRDCALQFRLAERPISLEEAAQRYGSVYRTLDTLPPDTFATAAGPARVLERHACVYGGRRFAHIVIAYRNQRVSMLVTDADGGAPFALPGEARLHGMSANRVDDMPVASFRTSRHIVFFVGDLDQTALANLASMLTPSLRRALA